MKLISISLWGTRELYLHGAIANARLAPRVYPGWTLRAYCSAEVPIQGVLRSLGVDVRVVPESPGYGGLFWRFLPAGEPDVEHVIVRDADSRLNVREKAAVDAWIASARPFHVMRDHSHHRDAPMLAGMWGCRGGSIPDIADRIARFSRGAVKHDDTRFLRDEIWPLIRERCLVHSSVPEPLGGEPFPAHPEFDGFVGEIVDPGVETRDVIAVLLPSRGRPEAALAAAQSAHASAAAPDRLCIEVGVEPDEVDAYRRAFGIHASWIRPLHSGGNYVRAIRELHRSTPAGIYGFSADDFRFETPGWDDEIRRAVANLPERLGLVYADDGLQGAMLATAPFVTAEWIACVGDPLPGEYTHLFCDTEITAIARSAGLLRFLPAVKITHVHYLAGAAMDATYERSVTTSSSGRTEFERRAEERQRIAERLEDASRAPRLSLLVAGVVQHAERLDALLATLHRQRMTLPDPSFVEVLVEPDSGERTAAAKRKSLLARARGRWVAFVDDEDVVADDALAVILGALEQGPDGLTVATSAGFGFQTSNRVVALRRTVAIAVSARDRAGREDFKWSATLAWFLTTEATIESDVFRPTSGSSARGGAADEAHRALDRPSLLAPPGLPSRAQQLLLTAAIGGRERALGAWREWVVEVGAESADDASIRLFPLAWWNLHRLGADGIELNALKPFYWQSWAASIDLSHRTGEVGRALGGAGIPAVVAHGLAVAVRHYAQPALRPTSAVDLLISRSQAAQAAALLEAAGWRAITPTRERGARRGTLSFRDRAGHPSHCIRRTPAGGTGASRWRSTARRCACSHRLTSSLTSVRAASSGRRPRACSGSRTSWRSSGRRRTGSTATASWLRRVPGVCCCGHETPCGGSATRSRSESWIPSAGVSMRHAAGSPIGSTRDSGSGRPQPGGTCWRAGSTRGRALELRPALRVARCSRRGDQRRRRAARGRPALPAAVADAGRGERNAALVSPVERAAVGRPDDVLAPRGRAHPRLRTDSRSVLRALEWQVSLLVAEEARDRIFVHAGVVEWKGKALVVPGRSFSGKSTLVAQLVRAGCAYLSDEYAILDSTGACHAHPRSLALRVPGGFEKRTAEELGGRTRRDPLPVGAVVVTRYRAGAVWQPLRLSSGQAAMALLQHTVVARARAREALSVLSVSTANVEALEGDRGDAAELVSALLSSPS